MYEYYNKNREQDQFIWKGKYFLPWWLFGFGHFWCNQAIIDKVMQRRKDCQGGLRNLLLSSNWWRTWSWYYYAYLGWNSQKSGKKRPRKDCPDRLLRTACSWFIYTDSIELCIYDWWFSKTFGVIKWKKDNFQKNET